MGGTTESNPKAHHQRHILYETINYNDNDDYNCDDYNNNDDVKFYKCNIFWLILRTFLTMIATLTIISESHMKHRMNTL